MRFNATMRAGIEFEDMKIDISDDSVEVRLPHAEVSSNIVDPGTITFVDEKKAVFNWNTQEDVAEAIEMAQNDIEENPVVDYTELIEQADRHAEELIHNLLDDSVGGREVKVTFK